MFCRPQAFVTLGKTIFDLSEVICFEEVDEGLVSIVFKDGSTTTVEATIECINKIIQDTAQKIGELSCQ